MVMVVMVGFGDEQRHIVVTGLNTTLLCALVMSDWTNRTHLMVEKAGWIWHLQILICHRLNCPYPWWN